MFTKKPSENMEDTEGKLVKIEGRVTGSQPMSVSWFKDDSEICSSDKYDISFKSNVAVLCIKSSQTVDSGRYTCQAANEAGKASCDVTVGISGGLSFAETNWTYSVLLRFPAVSSHVHSDGLTEIKEPGTLS